MVQHVRPQHLTYPTCRTYPALLTFPSLKSTTLLTLPYTNPTYPSYTYSTPTPLTFPYTNFSRGATVKPWGRCTAHPKPCRNSSDGPPEAPDFPAGLERSGGLEVELPQGSNPNPDAFLRSGCMKNTDRTLQLVNGVEFSFTLAKGHVSNGCKMNCIYFKEPCFNPPKSGLPKIWACLFLATLVAWLGEPGTNTCVAWGFGTWTLKIRLATHVIAPRLYELRS